MLNVLFELLLFFRFADPPHYFLSGDQWYNVQEKIDEIWKNEEEILKIFVGCNGHYYIDTGKSCYWNLRNFDSDDYECNPKLFIALRFLCTPEVLIKS